MIGLGSIAPGVKKPVVPAIDPEVAKELFAKLCVVNTLFYLIRLADNVDLGRKQLCFSQPTILPMQISSFAII